MKKCNSAALLLLLFTFGFALQPSGAQIAEESVDLLSLFQTIKDNMPRAGTEGFVKPTAGELGMWDNLVSLLIRGDWSSADQLIRVNFPFYRLVLVTDIGYQNTTYYGLIEEFPVSRGWGTFLVNPDFRESHCIEIPHAIYDTNTSQEGVDIFRRTGSRFLLMAGTHRCANAEISTCDGSFSGCGASRYPVSDVAHFVDAPFQRAHETIVQILPETVTFSLHGHSRSNCEDFFLSNGHATQSHHLISVLKERLLAAGGVTAAVAGDGTSSCVLIGSTNVQGRYSNGSPNPCTVAAASTTGFFIHVEQSLRVRSNLSLYSKLVTAIDGGSAATSVKSRLALPDRIPASISAYPNPFSSSTTIDFELTRPARVTLKVYNLRGQVVRLLEQDIFRRPGQIQITWNGLDQMGRPLPSGAYFVELTTGETVRTSKFTLLRSP